MKQLRNHKLQSRSLKETRDGCWFTLPCRVTVYGSSGVFETFSHACSWGGNLQKELGIERRAGGQVSSPTLFVSPSVSHSPQLPESSEPGVSLLPDSRCPCGCGLPAPQGASAARCRGCGEPPEEPRAPMLGKQEEKLCFRTLVSTGSVYVPAQCFAKCLLS